MNVLKSIEDLLRELVSVLNPKDPELLFNKLNEEEVVGRLSQLALEAHLKLKDREVNLRQKNQGNVNSARQEAYVVSTRMGLGHLRAAYGLLDIAYGGKILNMGEESTADEKERKLWVKLQKSYEAVSRLKSIPLIGNLLFDLYDTLIQKVPVPYPPKNLTKPTILNLMMERLVKKGMGGALVEKMKEHPLPMIGTYPVASIVANGYKYGPNYQMVCDARINRGYVPVDAVNNNVTFFTWCIMAKDCIKEYGVPDNRIFITGFPFPEKVLGTNPHSFDILKRDVAQRIRNLTSDEQWKEFWELHDGAVLGWKNIHSVVKKPLSITFCVGGAGAQKEIGLQAAQSLKEKILRREVQLNLACGVRPEIRDYFQAGLKQLGIPENFVRIVFSAEYEQHFEEFYDVIRATDILWTKPSELTFFVGLGLPMIIAPPIGSQETFNRKWLLDYALAGVDQEDPRYIHDWLYKFIDNGSWATMAWDGLVNGHFCGNRRIKEILATGTMRKDKDVHYLLRGYF